MPRAPARRLPRFGPGDAATIAVLAAGGTMLSAGTHLDPAWWGVVPVRPSFVGLASACAAVLVAVLVELHPRREHGRLPALALVAAVVAVVAAPFVAGWTGRLPGATVPAAFDVRHGAGGGLALVLLAILAAVLLPPGPGGDRVRSGVATAGSVLAGFAALLLLVRVLELPVLAERFPPPGEPERARTIAVLATLLAVTGALGTAASRGTVPMRTRGRGARATGGRLVDRGHLSWLLRNAVEPLVAAALAVAPVGILFGRSATVATILVAMAIAGVTVLLALRTDKRAAEDGFPRIPERTLHLAEAAGGWPFSIAGRQWFRHKRAKGTYVRTSRWMILVHLLGAAGLIAGSILVERARGG